MDSSSLLTSDQVSPALLGAAWRSGEVGGHEAAASLLRLVATGRVAVSPSAGSDICVLSLARASGRHAQDGLDTMDRELVAAVFQGQASITLAGLLAAPPLQAQALASGLSKWRQLVEREAVRRRMSGAAAIITRSDLRHVRREVSQLLDEARHAQGADLPPRVLEIAAVFGFERKLQVALSNLSTQHALQSPAASARWLCSARCGRSTVLGCVRRALNARPSSPPLAFGVTIPTHQMPRVVDDGKTRLGG